MFNLLTYLTTQYIAWRVTVKTYNAVLRTKTCFTLHSFSNRWQIRFLNGPVANRLQRWRSLFKACQEAACEERMSLDGSHQRWQFLHTDSKETGNWRDENLKPTTPECTKSRIEFQKFSGVISRGILSYRPTTGEGRCGKERERNKQE